jgi:hypothetical protein
VTGEPWLKKKGNPMGGLWSIITILGPILLLAAIIYAWWRNKTGSRGDFERAEKGAADLREDIRQDPHYDPED